MRERLLRAPWSLPHEHPWVDDEYVDTWIRKQEAAGSKRRRRYRRGVHGLELERDSKARILELGIGWGDQAAQMLDAHPGIRLVGIDVSEPMLVRARARLAAWSDRVQLHRRDLAAPDALLGLGEFDGAISSMTLHHLPATAIRRLYADIARLIRSEGVFVDVDRFEPPDSSASRVLHRIGFSPLRCIGPVRRMVDGLGVDIERRSGAGIDRPTRMRLVDRIAMLEAAGFACTFESNPAAVTLVARRSGPSSVDPSTVDP